MDLTFKKLQETSSSRSKRWRKGKIWSLSDWGVAVAGETGEICDTIKKLNRARDGMVGNKKSESELRENLKEELADTIMYISLLATSEGIDLEQAIISKFNKVSEKHGFHERLDNELENLTTTYLKHLWDYMAAEDGVYTEGSKKYIVQDGGHTVNGLFMDDVHAEMNRRGEGKYVAV